MLLPSTVVLAEQSIDRVPTHVRVVMDDNYPPLVMRKDDGDLEGYLADAWKLWEKKTGIPVELIAQDWHLAQRTMARGEADVIDTIFVTEVRKQTLDFSAPYESVPVAIYTQADITGIVDVAALEGFVVGVKTGDACIDKLKDKGISTLQAYPGYTDLLHAALANHVQVFCMDELPANYLMLREDVRQHFKKAFVIDKGEFHRAVRKGNTKLLALVEQGFALFSDKELQALHNKWMGQELSNPLYRYFINAVIVSVVIILLLFGITLFLRKLVKQRTAALLASKSHLQATLDAVPDLLFELDINGRYLEIHAPRTDLLAAPTDELLGRTVMDILSPDAAKICLSAIRKAGTEGYASGQQIEVKLADGLHWFELSVSRKEAAYQAQPTYVVLSRDITTRKLAELKVERLSKLYAALSQCNEAIIRCENEVELFPQICRDAVTFGELSIAWIGMLDQEQQTIRSVASYGENTELVKDIDISIDVNEPTNSNLISLSIHKDQPVWSQDYQGDSRTIVNKDYDVVFGWQAAAVLPLHRNAEVVGAFILYADELNAFDEEAKNLLVKMAMNISYALDGFALRVERKQLLIREQKAHAKADNARITLLEVINRVSDGFVALDKNWHYTFVNDNAAEILGRSSDQLIGKHIWTEFPDGVGQKFYHAYQKAMTEQEPCYLEEYYPPYDRWFENYIYPSPQGLTIYFHDVTKRKKAELELVKSEEKFRTIIESSPVALAVNDKALNITLLNQKFIDTFGYTLTDIPSLDEWWSLAYPDPAYRQRVNQEWQVAIEKSQREGAEFQPLEYKVACKDGSIRDIRFSMSRMGSSNLVIFYDITERKQREETLSMLSMAVEQTSNAILITDIDANIEYTNQAFTDVTGYSLNEVVGKNPRILNSGKNSPEIYQEMWMKLGRGEEWRGELININKDGIEYVDMTLISPVRDALGEITNYLAINENITEKKQAEARIKQLAYFDQLTGLPNREQLTNRFNYTLSLAERSGDTFTLMFLDLDHFKNINDTLGHSVGDQILMEVANRLKRILREEDTLCRMGGDEFILLLPDTNEDGAREVVTKVINIVSQPSKLKQQELTSTVSVGIAIYPDDGQNFETLSKNADAAMYRVKKASRNGYRFFTKEMQAHSARILQVTNALRYALERNELSLHYQPQITSEGDRIIGVEALLRWQHPVMGFVSPAEFIHIAEESGQMIQIGEWVLRTAVNQLKKWLEDELPPIVVAVNLSAVQFRHPNLPDLVKRIIDEARLPPEYLELELTEAVTMDDPQSAIDIMNTLHDLGVRMSIDDFGTGYSSLSYLKKFKVYKLKIDQSFIRDITEDPDDKAIVAAIISLAKSLGMQTIAEGVETVNQLACLHSQGCDEIQGYYYSKPLPANELEAFVTSFDKLLK
jgi:diguanylate cyclase (GGDEF)-like protein/PAS domain S-box-containing protein